MNIWIFNHYAITPDMPGGTRHYDLARELVRRGHQVTIFASSFSHKQRRDSKVPSGEKTQIEMVDGVRFVWIKTFPYQRNNWRRVLNMFSYMLRAWWIGRRLHKVSGIERPEVIIGSSPHLLAPLAAYMVASHYEVPFVMEVRDLWPQVLIDANKLKERSISVKVLQGLERLLYRRAKQIISLLPLSYKYIVTRGISREKITWIPNGINLSQFPDTESVSSERGKVTVMYLGAYNPGKALDVLVEAAKLVQDQGYLENRFVFVGDGPERSNLMRLAKSLKVGNLEFRNAVPKSDVPIVLHEANICVLQSGVVGAFRFGISSNKLFDYLASSKPVVFPAGAFSDTLEKAHCGIGFQARNPESLAEAIIELSRMPKEEREAMGRRGREYVEKYHSIPVLADKLIECIEDVGKQ